MGDRLDTTKGVGKLFAKTYEGDASIADLVRMDLRSLRDWFAGLRLEGRQATIGEPIVKEPAGTTTISGRETAWSSAVTRP